MTTRERKAPGVARLAGYAAATLALGALAIYLTPAIYGAPIRFTVAGIVIAAAAGVVAANTWVRPKLGLATTALGVVAVWAVLGPLLPLLTGACGDAGACTAPKLASWVVSGALWGALSILVAALVVAARRGGRLSLTILRSARRFITGARTTPPPATKTVKTRPKADITSASQGSGKARSKTTAGKEKSS